MLLPPRFICLLSKQRKKPLSKSGYLSIAESPKSHFKLSSILIRPLARSLVADSVTGAQGYRISHPPSLAPPLPLSLCLSKSPLSLLCALRIWDAISPGYTLPYRDTMPLLITPFCAQKTKSVPLGLARKAFSGII